MSQHEPVTQYFNMLHSELAGNDVEFQTARLNTQAVMLLASFSCNFSCPLRPPLPK